MDSGDVTVAFIFFTKALFLSMFEGPKLEALAGVDIGRELGGSNVPIFVGSTRDTNALVGGGDELGGTFVMAL